MSQTARPLRSALALCLMGACLAGCATPDIPGTMNDPIEPFNRQVHAFNRAIDQNALRPIAVSTTGGGELGARVSDFAENLGKPADIVNNILQLRLIKATENTLRFGMNTVFGLGGLYDVASAAGMPENDTDFGETLHVWGIPEGAYLELPFIGPSTERDFVGAIVDIVIDPLNQLPRDERLAATAAKVAGRIADRGRYSDLIDSTLYESADSYAQARLLYLQNRRFELGQSASEDSFVDPYEDPYAE
ncbi:MlaA family lipoprotein [Tabrizicola sp.]|uniref:MlaA family lipoprotein n=1 Tax=Tabrizicola sp. TaxID=2005166 RepID=UPI003D27EA32